MVEIDRSDTLTGEKDIGVENWVMVEVSEEVIEGIQNTPDTSIAGPVAVAGETQATEGQGDHNEGFTQVTEGLRLELEKVQITQPVPSQKEIWDTLGEPSGKYDYLVKYSAPESSRVQIEDIKPTGWGDDETKEGDLEINMVDMERPRSEMKEVEKYLEKEKHRMGDNHTGDDTLKDYLMSCHKGDPGMILCPRCSILCNQRIAANFDRIQRARTGNNWRHLNYRSKQCKPIFK